MRYALKNFADRMEVELQNNDDNPHWSNLTLHSIHETISKKERKLKDAVCKNDYKSIIKHSVDIANYCMFLADNSKTKIGDKGERTKEST